MFESGWQARSLHRPVRSFPDASLLALVSCSTLPHLSRSADSLLGQVGLVLFGNADIFQTLKFMSLDALNLQALVLNSLAHLTAFFEVIETCLLFTLGVNTDLVADGGGVAAEGVLLLRGDLALLFLHLLLLLNDAQELVTLGLGLRSKHDLALDELSAAADVEICGLAATHLGLLQLFSPVSALTLLESSLGSERVDFALAVSSPLLKLAQPLDLELLLFLDGARLLSGVLLLGDAVGVVTHDFQILLALLTQLLGLAVQGNFVGDFDLSEHIAVSSLLSLSNAHVNESLLLNLFHHLLLLALKHLTLFKTVLLTLLDLLDDNGGTAAFGLKAKLFTLVLSLECLQALNLHHDV